jgi:hypothetical protein
LAGPSAVPEWGKIGIFNRSHYEDVLVVRVHDLVPKKVWSRRYDEINDFERMLSDSGVQIVKFLLYISKEEQAKRFRERIEDKQKNWKFSPDDLKERQYWNDYVDAFEDMLHKCSKKHAPWYVIPANEKWFRNLAVSQILCDTLRRRRNTSPRRDVQVHHAQAADGAAHVHVVQIPVPLRTKAAKFAPILGPGKDQQEKADFQAEGDEHHRGVL